MEAANKEMDMKVEKKSKFLHGTLEVTIFHATGSKSSSPLDCLTPNGKPTYVTTKLDDHTVAETSHERDRVWNQTFRILCAHPLDSTITITVRTKLCVLGQIQFTGHKLVNDTSFVSGFFPLPPYHHHHKKKTKKKKLIKLQFILWFKPAEFEPTWSKLINHGSFFQGLRNSTFPQRADCDVILYQDTHHRPSFQPPLLSSTATGEGRDHHRPRKLWEDVYTAIDEAKHLIYIAGWSLNPNLVLIREDSNTELQQQRGKGVKLGELLKRKADEGVAVRLMLWDDETSIPFLRNKGMMKTHDEDAFAYFKNTRVVCRLCLRLDNGLPTPFSHHQKTITVDTRVKSSSSSSRREIMSFIGGVDLCDGRYDTEEHSLFKTLNTDDDDFYQTSIEGATLQKGGPREPWHDAHACVIGEAAKDILSNFEQRWRKQCDDEDRPSSLLPPETMMKLSSSTSFQEPTDSRKWNVQVFRSIDHFSAPATPNMVSRTESSIHEAYVEAIRRAERFIYIENQYFMGGCRLWDKDQHCGCRNLIPIEIAMKVANKIRARERFAVYIVIPLWPEGVPESESIQEMLHWTRETMAMMYKIIGDAISETGGTGSHQHHHHPRDYLNFFCLANREEVSAGEYVAPSAPNGSTLYSNAQNSRRFMVYVHSKLMIVDDVYIIMGSANINQRSMDGTRDTEIAIGCYLSQQGENEPITPDIKTYRMSLWYEHTGKMEESYQKPESLQCTEGLRILGDKMWGVYSRDEVVDMEGIHWVSYPVSVNKDGSLEDIAGWSHFPDTKAPIKGTRSIILPTIFTT